MPPFRLALILTALAAVLCACASDASAPAPTQTTQAPPAAIALLFETSGDAGYTAEILDALSREHVRATFTVTGLWAEQHRDLLLAIAAAGHQIINGGYHGTSFTGASTNMPPLTTDERTLELSRTEVTVYHLTGRSTRPYWQPPHNDVDDSARRDAATAGYTKTIIPTADTADSRNASADEIVSHLVAAATPGAVLALHTDAPQDTAALPQLITNLRANKITLSAIEDLPTN